MLDVKGLSVQFAGRVVLNDFTFRFPATGLVALIGPNGSGKSTLLDVLSGFIRASGGSITSQETGRRFTARELRRVCVRLHQRTVLPGDTTVVQYLAATASYRASSLLWSSPPAFRRSMEEAEANLRAAAARARTMISPTAKLDDLSGGQRRLVAFLGVMCSRKPVLLVDEPCAGMSEIAALYAMESLMAMAEKRLVVMADHDLARVNRYARHTMLLINGSLREIFDQGTVDPESVVARYA